MMKPRIVTAILVLCSSFTAAVAADWHQQYDPQCTERENVFAFTQKPAVKLVGKDRYEITFAVKGYCDVEVGMIDENGRTVRHIGAGVLGANAPEPFQKNSLSQKVYWKGKDDFGLYVREPGKLRVRVRLGLKPEFHRLLGPTSHKAIPGYVFGIAIDESGAYVIPKGSHMATIRKFDHDGSYIKTIYPPAPDLPEKRLEGLAYIEYEPGKKSPLGLETGHTLKWGYFLTKGIGGGRPLECQTVAANGRVYFCGVEGRDKPKLHWFPGEGGTEAAGLEGRLWSKHHGGSYFSLAVAPDGKTFYLSGIGNNSRHNNSSSIVMRMNLDEQGPGKVFVGGAPGTGPNQLNNPGGIGCDAQGRLYVTDTSNNRLQIFSPEGKLLKSIKADRPRMVQVHQKHGAVYVSHMARTRGRSSSVLTKLKPFPDLSKEHSWDNLSFTILAIDSWTKKTRLWLSKHPHETGLLHLGMYLSTRGGGREAMVAPYSVRVYEEDNGTLTKIIDFDDDAVKEDGDNYHDRWGATSSDEVDCDPVRERLVYMKKYQFDLETGRFLGTPVHKRKDEFRSLFPGKTDDFSFDKYGYLHLCMPHGHEPPLTAGVIRLNPDETVMVPRGRSSVPRYAEVPYDYGEKSGIWIGAVKRYATDRHGYSWGMGVNMRGQIAVVQNVGMVPSMPELSAAIASAGQRARSAESGRGGATGELTQETYAAYMRQLAEREKTGEQFFIVKRRPGSQITGGTIATFYRTGEVRDLPAAVTGGRTLDVDIDEDGFLYFTNSAVKLIGGKAYLNKRGGFYGSDRKWSPSTGVYVKTQPRDVLWRYEDSPTPLDEIPARPAEMVEGSRGVSSNRIWTTGTKWIYAGASPMPTWTCICPQLRAHLDWYKRSFVPETIRHSIAVLDTNGNLLMHIGRYGNRDSGYGPGSMIKVGGDGITSMQIRYISGTDNYLAFGDWGERLVVLKLNHHTEEIVPVEL
jgi:hypothetical protein